MRLTELFILNKTELYTLCHAKGIMTIEFAYAKIKTHFIKWVFCIVFTIDIFR